MDFVDYGEPANPDVNQWATLINTQAAAAAVPPCALAAIVERESSGKNIFQVGVPRGPGCGCGLTQITYKVDWTDPAAPTYHLSGQTWPLMDPNSNLHVSATGFLAPAINACLFLRKQYGAAMAGFSPEILYFAFAAYNAGFEEAVSSSVKKGIDPDTMTTNNYATGTVAIYHRMVAASTAAQ